MKALYVQGVETNRFQHGVKLMMSTCTAPPRPEARGRNIPGRQMARPSADCHGARHLSVSALLSALVNPCGWEVRRRSAWSRGVAPDVKCLCSLSCLLGWGWAWAWGPRLDWGRFCPRGVSPYPKSLESKKKTNNRALSIIAFFLNMFTRADGPRCKRETE